MRVAFYSFPVLTTIMNFSLAVVGCGARAVQGIDEQAGWALQAARGAPGISVTRLTGRRPSHQGQAASVAG